MRNLAFVLAVLAAVDCTAKTFWIKNGTTDWTQASSYLDEDNTSAVSEPPGEGDLVIIPSGNTTVYLDASDTASWTLVNKLSQIAPRGTSSKLVITVSEGEATISIPITLFSTTIPGVSSTYTSTAWQYGTIVKLGNGTLNLTCVGQKKSSNSCYDYDTSFDIQAGTIFLPQTCTDKQSCYFGRISIDAGATLFTCRHADENVSSGATYVKSLSGGGSVTNAYQAGITTSNSQQYYFGVNGYETNAVFSGRIDGAIRIIVPGIFNMPSTNNTNTGSSTLNGGEWTVGGIGKRNGEVTSSMGVGTWLYVREAGGTLRYSGQGEAVSRSIGFSPSEKPFVIDAGPVGGLDFTDRWYNYYSSTARPAKMRNLVLTGSNTVPCTVNVEMETDTLFQQGTNFTCYMIKEGTGTWRFKDSATHINNNGFCVKEGTLQFDSIDEAGVVCALGTATNLTDGYIGDYDPDRAKDYAFKLGGTVKSGEPGEATFEFTGTNRSWCGSRSFALAGDARIKNDTGRPLRLAGLSGLGAGTRTITFCGTGTNEFYDITDGESTVSVRKTGSGDWTLGGDLSFSGSLSVDEGTLTVRKESGIYDWFRWTLKEQNGATKAEFQVDEFALFSSGSVRQNVCPAGKLDSVEALDPFLIQPGQATFGTLRPLVFTQNTTGGITYNGRLPYLFSAYNEYGLRVSAVQAGTSATKIHSSLDDPNTWIPIVMRLTNGTPEIVSFDYVNVYGSASASSVSAVKAYSLEGSINGLQWDTLYATNDAPLASASWYWTSADKRFNNNEIVVSATSGYPIRGHSLRTFSTLSDVSAISVAAGATLQIAGLAENETLPLKSGVTLTVDCGQTSAPATIRGLAFPETGTVNLVNVPKGGSAFVPMDTSASVGFAANVSRWTVKKDGELTKYKISASSSGISVVPPGMVILVR